jgi:hypothetical protein
LTGRSSAIFRDFGDERGLGGSPGRLPLENVVSDGFRGIYFFVNLDLQNFGAYLGFLLFFGVLPEALNQLLLGLLQLGDARLYHELVFHDLRVCF